MGRSIQSGRTASGFIYAAAMTARLVLRTDLPAVAGALGRAFADDPMMRWVTGEADDEERRVTIATSGFFAPSLAAGFVRGHCYVTPDGDGAAVWSPPDVPLFGDAEVAVLADSLVEQCGPEALGRLMALGELVGAHHPEERPHFYLFLLGAVTKGRGAGSRALQPVLERCDADGLPAYLESSSARNLSFYERHGFRVTWEAAPEGGPVMRGMWREPGSGRG